MRMKKNIIVLACVALLASCGQQSDNAQKNHESLKKYFGSGFAIDYPEGFTVNTKPDGVVMGDDFTINVKIQPSQNKKKGSFPKDFHEADKAGIAESQFVKNWVGSNLGYIFKSDILVIQLVPLSGATVSVMCSPGKETVDFPAKAGEVLASFKITDEKKLLESLNLGLPEDEQTQTKPPQKQETKKTIVNTKGLRQEEFYENDDVFVRLPYRYFAKSAASGIVIIGVTNKDKYPQSIVIQQLEKTGLPLEKSANMIMGGQKTTLVQFGNYKYYRYDQPDTSNNGSQIVLIGQSSKFEVRITIKGSLGLTGSNIELLKSIVYK